MPSYLIWYSMLWAVVREKKWLEMKLWMTTSLIHKQLIDKRQDDDNLLLLVFSFECILQNGKGTELKTTLKTRCVYLSCPKYWYIVRRCFCFGGLFFVLFRWCVQHKWIRLRTRDLFIFDLFCKHSHHSIFSKQKKVFARLKIHSIEYVLSE